MPTNHTNSFVRFLRGLLDQEQNGIIVTEKKTMNEWIDDDDDNDSFNNK